MVNKTFDYYMDAWRQFKAQGIVRTRKMRRAYNWREHHPPDHITPRHWTSMRYRALRKTLPSWKKYTG